MEDKIKEIVSVFIKVPKEQIGPSTIVDRSVMQSSILLHRMYAKLAEAGVTVVNYTEIKHFSDLLQRQTGGTLPADGPAGQLAAEDHSSVHGGSPNTGGGNAVNVHSGYVHAGNGLPGAAMANFSATDLMAPGIGIDIEAIASLPETHDFRKTEFYKMNFAPAEIAYCVLQPDPYASFAGLFAAKEAIVKAKGDYGGMEFNRIEIGHSEAGRPTHPGFNLSVSHAAGVAIAVAVPAGNSVSGQQELSLPLQRGLAEKGGRDHRYPGWQ